MKQNRYFTFLILFIVFMFFSITNTFAVDKYAKVILIGDYRCGKTSLWKRLTNQNFDENEPNSDMMNYESIVENIDGQTIQFNIWDTAGANMYYDEVVDFTCDANFVIIVHDISAVYNEKVEQYLNKLYFDIHNKVTPNCSILIAGTKYDLRHANIINSSRQIGMLESVAKTIPCSCTLTSAQDTNDRGINSIKQFLKNKSKFISLSTQNPDASKMKRFSVKKKSGGCILI